MNTADWTRAKTRFNLNASQKKAFDEWVKWRANVTSAEKEKKVQVSTGFVRAPPDNSPGFVRAPAKKLTFPHRRPP